MKTSISFACFLLLALAVGIRAEWNYNLLSYYTDKAHSYYTATLGYDGTNTYYANTTNNISKTLNFTYFFMSPSHLIVRLTDATKDKWEVPHEYPFPHSNYSNKFAPYDNALLSVKVTNKPFTFKVIRTSTNEVLFDSSAGNLIFSDYYLQLSTALTTPNIYGMGERAYQLNLGPDGTYTIMNKDQPVVIEDGTTGNNLYGYHPVYLQREKSNKFHMNLLRSSNSLDFKIEGGKKLTYKVTGGIFDFNFFAGESKDSTPETVVKQYHNYLGGWALQPFWSFGFHQCRWGYKNAAALKNVLDNYEKHNLPLDVIWSDIDYLEKKIDFTIDVKNFPLLTMRNMLKQYQKRWVPIIDAGIAVNNSIHTIGLKGDVYIKSPNGTNLLGQVWPGPVNYPDFFNPNTSLFWSLGLTTLYNLVPFSGIWLDMNEASNFVPGEDGFIPKNNDILNNPPYNPSKDGEMIYTKTMRMDAYHHQGFLEYDVHNTFGFLESKATYNFLKTIDDLTFILTRSSFYGSGRYAAHWTGDNGASFEFLALSIPTIINSGIYGMPMAGADICGFAGDTTEELCSRWFQLGALYPFARNHNDDQSRSQEPWAFGGTLLNTARINLNFRYAILKHYYTQFLKQKGSGTIFRPLFFEFPNDSNLYNSALGYTDSQFMIGQSLMAVPVLTEGAEGVTAYFPNGTWFNFITGALMKTQGHMLRTSYVKAPLNETAPVFIRGGHIVPVQINPTVRRTDDLDSTFVLVVAFQETSKRGTYQAVGDLIGAKNLDSTSIMQKCQYTSCLYTVDSTIVRSGTSFDLTIDFTAQGPSGSYELTQIQKLAMTGDWGLSYNTLEYEFETPFVVKNGAQIKLHIEGKTHEPKEKIRVSSKLWK